MQGANLQGTQLRGADLRNAQLRGSFGHPNPEHSVGESYVSYNLPADKSRYLKNLVSNEITPVKLAWGRRPGVSLEEHLKKHLEEDQRQRAHLPDKYSQPNLCTWAEWTAQFACEDEYTARSSLKRLELKALPPSLKDKDSDEAQKLVREALVDARESGEECPGLHSIQDDEWEEFSGS